MRRLLFVIHYTYIVGFLAAVPTVTPSSLAVAFFLWACIVFVVLLYQALPERMR